MVHEGIKKGGNSGNIKSMGTYNHVIVRQNALLGVLDNCVKEQNVLPVPMNI